VIAEATDGVNVGLNLLHPLLLQGFGGVAPKNCLQQTTYMIFCNNLHFASAKNTYGALENHDIILMLQREGNSFLKRKNPSIFRTI